MSKEKGMYQCSECNKSLKTRQALNAHKVAHKNGPRYSVVRRNSTTYKKEPKIFICKNCGKENNHKKTTTNTFCDSKCSGEYRTKIWWQEKRPLFETGKLGSRAAIKRFVLERDGNCCSICNQNSYHNGKSLTMVLDHIDGDASNNMPKNFRLLCPNCDSQQDTYKARNRGKGRATRGMKWYSSL